MYTVFRVCERFKIDIDDFYKKPIETQRKYLVYEEIRQLEEIELLAARLGAKHA